MTTGARVNGDLESVWAEMRWVRDQIMALRNDVMELRTYQAEAKLRRVQFPSWLAIVISAGMGALLFILDRLWN